MPCSNALEALLKAYLDEIASLTVHAKECRDAKPRMAAEYVRRATNLQATVETLKSQL